LRYQLVDPAGEEDSGKQKLQTKGDHDEKNSLF
jgi:hypothetical protein